MGFHSNSAIYPRSSLSICPHRSRGQMKLFKLGSNLIPTSSIWKNWYEAWQSIPGKLWEGETKFQRGLWCLIIEQMGPESVIFS